MRLLLVNYEYPPIGAGAANATGQIARALVALGHRPIVLTAAYRSLPLRGDVDGVTVVRVPAKRARADQSNIFEMATYVVSAAVALPRILRTENPDAAIVFFSMPCGPLGLLARWWARLPYVVSLRGGDVPGQERSLNLSYTLLAPLRRLVLRSASAVVANSSGLKALSEAADPIDVAVIPNGVDSDFFRPAPRCENRPFTFLFVGRFQAQKNLAFLLDAIAALRRSAPPPFRVVLVGDGPERAHLQHRCTTAGLDDIVSWHGWCDKLRLLGYYQQADCLLNPSLAEGMPNTVLEAMACGLPVIASDVLGNDAVVVPGETGYLVSLSRPQEYAEAMHRVAADPVSAGRMGMAGRQHAIRRFSWEAVAREYVALLTCKGVLPRHWK